MENRSLKSLLILSFMAIGLTPLTIMALSSYFPSTNELKSHSFDQLEAVNALKNVVNPTTYAAVNRAKHWF